MISEHNEQTIDFYFMIIQVIKCYKELSFLYLLTLMLKRRSKAEDGSPKPRKTTPRM